MAETKFGARVYFHGDDVIQILQTVRKGELPNARYVLDVDGEGKTKGVCVPAGADQERNVFAILRHCEIGAMPTFNADQSSPEVIDRPTLSDAPVVSLKNGTRVANFSSGHTFTFDDGSILPACQNDRVEALKLERSDTVVDRGTWKDVTLGFSLSLEVLNELLDLDADPAIHVVLCPLPVVECLRREQSDPAKAKFKPHSLMIKKARTIVRTQRETAGNPSTICSDRFGT